MKNPVGLPLSKFGYERIRFTKIITKVCKTKNTYLIGNSVAFLLLLGLSDWLLYRLALHLGCVIALFLQLDIALVPGNSLPDSLLDGVALLLLLSVAFSKIKSNNIL